MTGGTPTPLWRMVAVWLAYATAERALRAAIYLDPNGAGSDTARALAAGTRPHHPALNTEDHT